MIEEKIEIWSITDDFKNLANTVESRYKKYMLTSFKKILRLHEKMVINDCRNDIDYDIDKQYQSFSDNTLLSFNEYLEKLGQT